MATPSLAQDAGTVLLKPRVGSLTDSAGDAFGTGKLVLFVVDLNGDGVQHPTLDAFAPGTDDFVIGSAQSALSSGVTLAAGGVNFAVNSSLYDAGPTVASGDSFAMFWFPELDRANFLGTGDNDDMEAWAGFAPGETSFGAYNTAESTPDSTWKVPTPPSAVDFEVFTKNVGGAAENHVLQAQFMTNGVIIPEPSSALLALLGSGLLLFRRRRS